MPIRKLPITTINSHNSGKHATYLIFFTTIAHFFLSPFANSRSFFVASVPIMIRHSPKPSAFSKYNAAFIGCTFGYADGFDSTAPTTLVSCGAEGCAAVSSPKTYASFNRCARNGSKSSSR